MKAGPATNFQGEMRIMIPDTNISEPMILFLVKILVHIYFFLFLMGNKVYDFWAWLFKTNDVISKTLKFQMLISQICQHFLLKKSAKASLIFSTKIHSK